MSSNLGCAGRCGLLLGASGRRRASSFVCQCVRLVCRHHVRADRVAGHSRVARAASSGAGRGRVPALYGAPEALPHDAPAVLRWLGQKDALGQDAFLVGPPGPERRRLAMAYAEGAGRPVEALSLSRDTSDADLRQRREIVGGTAVYVDAAPVRAATAGRLLILDGIEKAERNVLPTLNNLLENREMALADGRLLVSPRRYDALAAVLPPAALAAARLVRVHDDFRVLALGLPVPAFPGFALDPPLRSRFQARYVGGSPPGPLEELRLMRAQPGLPREVARRLLSFAATLRELCAGGGAGPSRRLLYCPPAAPAHAAAVLAAFPAQAPAADVLYRGFPCGVMRLEPAEADTVRALARHFGLAPAVEARGGGDGGAQSRIGGGGGAVPSASYELVALERGGGSGVAVATFVPVAGGPAVLLPVAAGPRAVCSAPPGYIATGALRALMVAMLQDHALGRDLCLMGGKGCGKSAAAHALAAMLGYHVESVHLYKDMSSRDLCQRRTTSATGDTAWELTPLVHAALAGHMLVLDGARNAAAAGRGGGIRQHTPRGRRRAQALQ